MRDDAGRPDGGDTGRSDRRGERRPAGEPGDGRGSLDPQDPPAAIDADADVDPDEEGADRGNVAGEFAPERPVEPGSPDLANALWVVAGAYVAVLGLVRVFVDPQGLAARDLLVLTAGTLLVTLVFLGFFGLLDLTPDT